MALLAVKKAWRSFSHFSADYDVNVADTKQHFRSSSSIDRFTLAGGGKLILDGAFVSKKR